MTTDELVIGLIARLLQNAGTVAVGSSSPVPAAAIIAGAGGVGRQDARADFPQQYQ